MAPPPNDADRCRTTHFNIPAATVPAAFPSGVVPNLASLKRAHSKDTYSSFSWQNRPNCSFHHNSRNDIENFSLEAGFNQDMSPLENTYTRDFGEARRVEEYTNQEEIDDTHDELYEDDTTIGGQNLQGGFLHDQDHWAIRRSGSLPITGSLGGCIASGQPSTGLALVLDGPTLACALVEENKADFLELVQHCASIICCRSTPAQKVCRIFYTRCYSVTFSLFISHRKAYYLVSYSLNTGFNLLAKLKKLKDCLTLFSQLVHIGRKTYSKAPCPGSIVCMIISSRTVDVVYSQTFAGIVSKPCYS
ncbi:unnamed protein product [Protopolystoma xenopodis]|uniref:Uncharacterized protein n=1 Tax=Protopolystoma xenopodis TaxID=117903 RepID=A0A448WYD2_9PLAT|nr:unnamed protein product [Protopolystoma xenopodis]